VKKGEKEEKGRETGKGKPSTCLYGDGAGIIRVQRVEHYKFMVWHNAIAGGADAAAPTQAM